MLIELEKWVLRRQDVEEAYRVLLGRDPESDAVVSAHLAAGSQLDMVKSIALSDEAISRIGVSRENPNPFFHYNSVLDVPQLVRNNIDPSRAPKVGFNVNFLGVAVPVDVFDFLKETSGHLDQIPIPANYHADMSEWAAALRAIDLARDTFTMIELGSSWGCWMANTGVVAKRRGLKIEVIGIEGDPLHIDMCNRTMASNAIEPDEYHVVRGIASAGSGYALFPKRVGDEARWGSEPIFGASLEESEQAVASGEYERLEMKPLAEVIGDRPRIDLLHIDIQGGETDLIRDTLDLLAEKVAYILIGTHSRMIEGQLMDMLLDRGWALEIERPAIFALPNCTPQTTVDGVQGWRNRRLNP